MILTKNDITGKMETVAGAGILPKVPMLEPDYTMLLKQIASTDSFFLQPGTVIPTGTRLYGTPFVLPWDCFVRLNFNMRNMDVNYTIFEQLPDDSYYSIGGVRPTTMGSTTPSLTFPLFFLRSGTKLVCGLYNNSGADVTLLTDLNQMYFYGVKLITATPNVIDVGTNPGYSLAEAPVMRTLADGTQEQLQTLDGDPIFQKTYTGQLGISSTMIEVALDDFTNKALLGVVPDYSYSYNPSTLIFNTWPKNDSNTWIEAMRKDNQLKIRARSSDVGTIKYVLTVRYCAL
jgi:hypothetical protein